MEITNTAQLTIIPRDSQKTRLVAHEEPLAARPGNAAFNVQLTERAKQMNEPVRTDTISHDKVTSIRDQLAAGTYSISGKDVANRILQALKG